MCANGNINNHNATIHYNITANTSTLPVIYYMTLWPSWACLPLSYSFITGHGTMHGYSSSAESFFFMHYILHPYLPTWYAINNTAFDSSLYGYFIVLFMAFSNHGNKYCIIYHDVACVWQDDLCVCCGILWCICVTCLQTSMKNMGLTYIRCTLRN